MTDYKNSYFYKAVWLKAHWSKALAVLLMVAGLCLALASLVLGEFLDLPTSSAFYFSIVVFLLNGVYVLFLEFLDSSEPGEFTLDATAALYYSSADQKFNPGKFLHWASNHAGMSWTIRHLGIPKNELPGLVRDRINTTYPLEDILKGARDSASGKPVSAADLLNGVLVKDGYVAEYFMRFDANLVNVSEAYAWHERISKARHQASRFWAPENLLNIKGIGKDWSAGWIRALDGVGRDLTAEALLHKAPPHLYGHKAYLEQISRGMVEGNKNVVLVGAPGVGRHTILKALAQTINTGRTYGPLRYQRMLQLDPTSLLARSGQGSALDRIKEIFGEAFAVGNLILVVNNIDALFSERQEVGRINATEALLPYLKSNLRLIGIASPQGYQNTIGRNPELERFFTKIEIEPATPESTLQIIEDEANRIEHQSGLVFLLSALREIVSLSNRLIQNLPNPEKSLEVLNEVATYTASNTDSRIVTQFNVQAVVSERTHVPVGNLNNKEKDLLLHLEEYLHHRVVGQDRALTQISDALRRSRAAVADTSRPIGSFLFLGPTGVGKTETTKALASIYFGSEDRIIRLDMSEYQEAHSIDRLLGSADQHTGGFLTDAVIAAPFSIILLDEIEKANAKIIDLFLQVLDEGRLTDALGRTASFDNCMIIATSNAGSELIREKVAAGAGANLKDELMEYLMKEHLFRPEFLNRFDGVIAFEPLTQENLMSVAEFAINALNKRLKEKQITIKPTPELLNFIVSKAYHPEFGARPLRRFIQDTVENYVAKGLLSGTIKRGNVLELTPDMLKVN